MTASGAQVEPEPGAGLFTGERRFVVALAVAFRIDGGGQIEDAARDVVAARSRVDRIVGAAGGRAVATPAAEMLVLWGQPVACSDDVELARAVADQITALLGDRVSVAVGAGEAIVLRACETVMWSPALERVRRLAEATPAGAVGLDCDLATASLRGPGPPVDLARLSPRARDVIASLAVLDEPVDPGQLAQLHGLSRRTLAAVLREFERIGLPVVRAEAGGSSLHLCPRIAAAVRETLLTSDRRRVHLAFAAVLGWQAGPLALAAGLPALTVARIAIHLEKAGDIAGAFTALRSAAEIASRAEDHAGVVDHLESALDLALRAPASISSSDRCDVIRATATSLGALRGNAEPRVRALYDRGLAVLEGAGQCPGEARFELVWGSGTHDLVGGEIGLARDAVHEAIELGARLVRDDLEQVAARLAGLVELMAGELGTARHHYRRALAYGDVARHPRGTLVLPFASDQISLALVGLSWLEAIAGNAGVSADLAAQASARAQEVGHPHTSLHVDCVLAARAHSIGATTDAFHIARRAEIFAGEHGFGYWASWAGVIRAATDPGLDPSEAVPQIDAALLAYAATGARQFLPFGTALLADALVRAGEPALARLRLQRVVDLVGQGKVELYRSITLVADARAAAAADDPAVRDGSRRTAAAAYEVARRQGATLFASRAAGAMMAVKANGAARAWGPIPRRLLA